MTPSVQKHIGGKTCATDKSELSMVHEGSSEIIEQGNIMIDFIRVCIARSMVDLVTQRNRLDFINATDCALECS